MLNKCMIIMIIIIKSLLQTGSAARDNVTLILASQEYIHKLNIT